MTAQSGAIWEHIQIEANKRGKSVIVKQASDLFSVRGSIGINCHGWAHKYGAISSYRRMETPSFKVGVYYQAYMPYATTEQFEACYGRERIENMRRLKAKYDPQNMFSNGHTQKYFDSHPAQEIG